MDSNILKFNNLILKTLILPKLLRIYCSLTDLVHELQQQFVFKLIIVLKLQHKLELFLFIIDITMTTK